VRQLAISASAFTFQARDATLIHSTNIFPLLQRIFSRDRTSEALNHVADEKAVVSTELALASGEMEEREKDRPHSKSSLVDSSSSIPTEKEKSDKLEAAAWTAFRLLVLQCTWEPGHDDTCDSPDDEPAIRALQQQIFVLVCYHLERLSLRFAKYALGDARAPEGLYGERCFQLLSLIQLCVAGDSLLALNFFSDSRCLQCFFAMLGTNLVCYVYCLFIYLFIYFFAIILPSAFPILYPFFTCLFRCSHVAGPAQSAAYSAPPPQAPHPSQGGR
jgi:hypothetical protein